MSLKAKYTTTAEVDAAIERVTGRLEIVGAGGCVEAVPLAKFVHARSKLGGKGEPIDADLKQRLLDGIGHGNTGWEMWEKRYNKLYPKNKAINTRAPRGSRTLISVDQAIARCIKGNLLAAAPKLYKGASAYRQAQNEFVNAAMIQSTKGSTRRRSFDEKEADKFRQALDLSINHFGGLDINGLRNTKKENR